MREILYGRQAVRESLRAGRRKPYKLILAEGVRQADVIGQIVFLAEQAGVEAIRAPRRNLRQIGNVHHQGVALEVSEYPYTTLDDIMAPSQAGEGPTLLLLLDRGEAGNIYHVAGEHEITNIDLAQMVLRNMGKPSTIQYK